MQAPVKMHRDNTVTGYIGQIYYLQTIGQVLSATDKITLAPTGRGSNNHCIWLGAPCSLSAESITSVTPP